MSTQPTLGPNINFSSTPSSSLPTNTVRTAAKKGNSHGNCKGPFHRHRRGHRSHHRRLLDFLPLAFPASCCDTETPLSNDFATGPLFTRTAFLIDYPELNDIVCYVPIATGSSKIIHSFSPDIKMKTSFS
ncbi:predicted protein [Histoplasma capsulatum var. duboisii H88]|uniref:Predicted protein n=2 Tax=Ajellomyces capsulatus TaxID=5037 RepID=F0U9A7_AJEC8|nr:predicted protein [Histoplasma capsulatum H143]EGC41057.1 predicted protein [Histoplasma capsulatum var. duboisii H88]